MELVLSEQGVGGNDVANKHLDSRPDTNDMETELNNETSTETNSKIENF